MSPIIYEKWEISDFSQSVLIQSGSNEDVCVVLGGFAQPAKTSISRYQAIHKGATFIGIEWPGFQEHDSHVERLTTEWVKGIIDSVVLRFQNSRIHLVGHSLGARIWLSYFIKFKPMVLSITLIAPMFYIHKTEPLLRKLPIIVQKSISNVMTTPWLLSTLKTISRGQVYNFLLKIEKIPNFRLIIQVYDNALRNFYFEEGEIVQFFMKSDIDKTLYLFSKDTVCDNERWKSWSVNARNLQLFELKGNHFGRI